MRAVQGEGGMKLRPVEVDHPHTGRTYCCFCGVAGSLWAGRDELGQDNGRHWPRGWRYNHGIYGYGPGNGNGCMCPACWEERQQPEWGRQPALPGIG